MNKLSGFLALTLAFAAGGARAFVYETVSEFQAEGDFYYNDTADLDIDAFPTRDYCVLDKLSATNII